VLTHTGLHLGIQLRLRTDERATLPAYTEVMVNLRGHLAELPLVDRIQGKRHSWVDHRQRVPGIRNHDVQIHVAYGTQR
jgi:hypothetical protein